MARMILARSWRRELSMGLGAAVIIPCSLLTALAVLALAGGFARVGALRQALTGPPPPAAAQGGARLSAGRVSADALLAAIPATATAVPASGSVGSRRGATGGSRRASGPTATGIPFGHPQPVPHPQPVLGTGRPPTRTPPAQQPTQPNPQPTSPNPQPHPTVVDKVVGAATSVTSQLPSPVGSVATSTLQAVGSTVDGLLPTLGQ
jgi:hypothetical protein